MSNLYNDFEKRFTGNSFSANWVEFEVKPQQTAQTVRKDVITLQAELEELNNAIERIAQKQLRLEHLAEFYKS